MVFVTERPRDLELEARCRRLVRLFSRIDLSLDGKVVSVSPPSSALTSSDTFFSG